MQQGAPDPFFAKALNAGGHLGDDVAQVLLESDEEETEEELAKSLRSEYPELD